MRNWCLAVAACAFLACTKSGTGDPVITGPGGTYPQDRPAGYVNPIAAENALAGDPGWALTRGDGAPSGSGAAKRPVHVEAYADRVAAKAGESVQVMANIPAGMGGPMGVHWALYRLGWYGGAGARKLAEGTATAGPQAACPPDPTTGLIQCHWSPTFTVQVPQGAVSGLYLVRILRDEPFPYGTYVPLVVKDDRMSDLYFQASVTTYEAYNRWMGESLYDDQLGLSSRFAVKVSFDRPYIHDYGAGHVLRYEAHMASFLERSGYDVSYTTNLDVTREGMGALRRHGAFLSVGHDEYWDGRQRDAVEGARDAGTHVFFFGANAAYWKVRLENPGADGNPRLMTCYKIRPQTDPLAADPVQRTGRYRDAPINRDEEALVGTMYEEQVLFGQAWVQPPRVSSKRWAITNSPAATRCPGWSGTSTTAASKTTRPAPRPWWRPRRWSTSSTAPGPRRRWCTGPPAARSSSALARSTSRSGWTILPPGRTAASAISAWNGWSRTCSSRR